MVVPFWNIDCNVRVKEIVERGKKESRKNFKMIFYSVIHSWAVIAGMSEREVRRQVRDVETTISVWNIPQTSTCFIFLRNSH